MRRFAAGWIAIAACSGGGGGVPDAGGTAHVRLLAINDFHGEIAQAAELATIVAARRDEHTVMLSAGDLFGGSPLESGYLHDVPTIEAMDAIGLDLDAVGNHELDEGNAELQRMQDGGCHPVDGCPGDEPFDGAAFRFLAANVVDQGTGETIFPAYELREIDGVTVAVVGMTLEGTRLATLASAIPELQFGDEVETMEALLPTLRDAGADVIVLAIHEGEDGGTCPPGLTGPIAEIAAALEDEVDVIVSGHSHTLYDCRVGDLVLTQAGDQGQFVTQIDLSVDRATGQVTAVTTENVPTEGATPDPTVAALVDHYEQLVAPIRDQIIGTITEDITNTIAPSGEKQTGAVVADAMLAAGGAELALMVTAGLRTSFTFALTAPETVDGQVRYGEAFAVQPFGNTVETVSLSGAELVAFLDSWGPGNVQIAGATFSWHASGGVGARVTAADVLVGGAALDPTHIYRVTVNAIVAQELPAEVDPEPLGVDLDLLVAYFAASSPISVPAPRITRLP